MSLELFQKPKDWMNKIELLKSQGKTVGFVPTMGALHEGHLSLVRKAKTENDFVLLSIFVNPTQFNDPKDLQSYPVNLEKDLELLKAEDVDFVFAPLAQEMYPDGYTYRIQETDMSKILCGEHRPGHFEGMLTVVMKLLNIAQAERAYFGEKDFQQLELVKNMVKAFFMKTEIVPCPTQRTESGLALSSRNARLAQNDLERANLFPQILKSKAKPEELRLALLKEGFDVDYVEEWKGRRLAAVRLGGVRLIDNVEVGANV